MKITVAIDSFKGSASSQDLNKAVKEAIKSTLANAEVETIAIADGGEGTISALSETLEGYFVEVETIDLLERPITATYFIADNNAFIESAEVVGLDKIIPTSETYNKATSFGLGALLKDAMLRGCHKIYITLGGTGSSDGGQGLLESLGFSIENKDLSCFDQFNGCEIIGLTDVKNPYYGEKGYSHIFGQQKGGNQIDRDISDKKAEQFTQDILEKHQIDLQIYEGSGAAGGIGGALVILGGELQNGFETITNILNLEHKLKDSDLIITGEGRLDLQSESGKVPVGMSRLAQKYQIPIIAICGSIAPQLSNRNHYFFATFSIQREVLSLEEAMNNKVTLTNIGLVTRDIISLLTIQLNNN